MTDLMPSKEVYEDLLAASAAMCRAAEIVADGGPSWIALKDLQEKTERLKTARTEALKSMYSAMTAE